MDLFNPKMIVRGAVIIDIASEKKVTSEVMYWCEANSIREELHQSMMWRDDEKRLWVQRGIMDSMYDLSKAEWEVNDEEYIYPQFNAELRPLQQDGVDAMMQNEGGLLIFPTATGKTFMAFGAAYQCKLKTLFICHTKEIANQTAKAANKILGIRPGILGDGVYDIQPFTISLIQTLYKNPEVLFPHFGMIIVDEVHHLPAKTWISAISRFPARKRFGMTATLYRRDKLVPVIIAAIGRPLLVKETDDADVKEHLTLPTIVPVATTFHVDKQTYCFHVCKYHGRCTPLKTIKNDKGQIDWKKLRKDRCKLFKFNYWRWMTDEMNNDKDRNALIVNFIKKKQGKANLILTDRIDHVDYLGEKLVEAGMEKVICLHSRVNKYVREMGIEEFRKNGGTIVATTSLLGEGFDAPDIDREFLLSPASTEGKIKQRVGRIMRKKEYEAIVYDFVDELTDELLITWWIRKRIYEKKLHLEIAKTNREGVNVT